jgi:hypothetical protein
MAILLSRIYQEQPCILLSSQIQHTDARLKSLGGSRELDRLRAAPNLCCSDLRSAISEHTSLWEDGGSSCSRVADS